MKFYTYAHYRNDSNVIFYIGKGTGNRAWSKRARNIHWNNIVNKHGYRVEILAYFETELEAFENEIHLIKCQKELGAVLVNMTEGGEGSSGFKHTEESKNKVRISKLGKKRPEITGKNHYLWGKKNPLISDRNKLKCKENHPFYGKKREKVSEMLRGEKNPNAKKVWVDELNAIFPTIAEAAMALNVKYDTLKRRIHRNPQKYWKE